MSTCSADSLKSLGLGDTVLSRKTVPDMISDTTTTKEMLDLLVTWFYQELFTDCGAEYRLYQPGVDFIDVLAYETPSQNKTGLMFALKLLSQLDQDLPAVSQLTNNLTTFASLFRFPRIREIDTVTSTVKLVLQFPFQAPSTSACASTTQQDNITEFLTTFYADSQWGLYTDSINGSTSPLTDVSVDEATLCANTDFNVGVDDGDGYRLYLYGFTVNTKLSFFQSLYQLIGEASGTGDLISRGILSILDPASFSQFRVDESVPIPVSSRLSQPDYCQDDAVCACAYFAVFKSSSAATEYPVSAPCHNLYINRYQEPHCLCYISRAIPEGENPVMNPFALCFDQSCLDPSVPTEGFVQECASVGCATARQYISGANWQSNFINAGALNRELVKNTCNMSVTPISFNRNRWELRPLLAASAALLVSSFPIYLLCRFFLVDGRRFLWSWWYLLFIALTCGLAVLGVFALDGQYVCNYGDMAALDVQAECRDRLTGKFSLSRQCCDVQDPIFCQCNPDSWDQKVCRSALATEFCKCQTNGTCIPASGDSGVVSASTQTARKLNLQIVMMCVAVFAVLGPLTTLGIHTWMAKWPVKKWWVPVLVNTGTLVLLFLLCVCLPSYLTYLWIPEETRVIDTVTQNAVCSVSLDSDPDSDNGGDVDDN